MSTESCRLLRASDPPFAPEERALSNIVIPCFFSRFLARRLYTLRPPFRPPHYSIMLAQILGPRWTDDRRNSHPQLSSPLSTPSAALACAWDKHPRPADRRLCLPLGPFPSVARTESPGARPRSSVSSVGTRFANMGRPAVSHAHRAVKSVQCITSV